MSLQTVELVVITLPQLQVAVISSYLGCVSAFIALNLTLRGANNTRDNSNIKYQYRVFNLTMGLQKL
jgi:hypothetical protein